MCEHLRQNGISEGFARPASFDVEGLSSERSEARVFQSPAGSGQTFRYILIGDVEVPGEIAPYLNGLTLFIVDALRNDPETQVPRTTATETIRSLSAFDPPRNSVILFTALQGSDLAEIEAENPGLRIISKLRDDELSLEFMRIIAESLDDD